MEDELKLLAKDLNAIILFGELDDPGHVIFPEILDGTAVIYIDSKLNSRQQKAVILHELGHIAKHERHSVELYNATLNMKLKMERNANGFMIRYLFRNYIDITGDDPHSVNYLEFMRQNDIPSRDEGIVKEIIASY